MIWYVLIALAVFLINMSAGKHLFPKKDPPLALPPSDDQGWTGPHIPEGTYDRYFEHAEAGILVWKSGKVTIASDYYTRLLPRHNDRRRKHLYSDIVEIHSSKRLNDYWNKKLLTD